MAQDILPEVGVMPTQEALKGQYIRLGRHIGDSDPDIQCVIIFDSQSKEGNYPDLKADINMAVIANSKLPSKFSEQIPDIQNKIKRALQMEGLRIREEKGNVNLEILRSTILTTSREQLSERERSIIEGVRIFEKQIK